MTTIRDVADEAGVSQTTVSHVFSNRRPVAAATRARVLDAARRLSYRPHAGARDLGARRSTTIALDIQVSEESLVLNPYFSAVLSALAASATANGFTFMLLPTTEAAIEATMPILGPARVAGAIVLEPTSTNPWIQRLVEAGVGVVSIGRYIGPAATSWVDNDHRAAATAVIDHLVSQGYRRIALITSTERYSYMQDLEEAFSSALADRAATGELIRIDDLTENAGRETAMHLLRRHPRPDAIVAAIDRVALGVLRAVQERGLNVPGDIGIAGGGDTVISQNSVPRLTSIRTTPDLLAQSAMEIINDAWANGWPAKPRTILIPSDLVVRESTLRHG